MRHRSVVVSLAIAATLVAATPVQSEVLAGHTYQFEGLHSRNTCGSPTGVTVRTKLWTYLAANGRDLFLYLTDGGGLHLDLQKVKSGGQSVNVKAGSNRYAATARMTGDQMSVTILGTNPRGGQAKHQFRYSMNGESCSALDFKLEVGGCGDDGQDARADRCFVFSGRPANTK